VYVVQAPAFIFVDEIDAIAGRHARKDPRRRSTFDALIAQLDGELVSTIKHTLKKLCLKEFLIYNFCKFQKRENWC
jgi:AAA+ superfamily predicted ATPase